MSDYTLDFTPLKKWFLANSRELPWRGNPTPYEVWVSEIMLQQTQVKVVIPYFERWMRKYPSIEALANAPLEEVIKLWEGLGYYSRARNLHAGAKQVMERFQGKLPNDPEKLAEIKGLGPYTIGAILSFAFQQKAPAVDGNIQRVLARLFHITEDFSKSSTQKQIWKIAEEVLPEKEPWIVNEALIELGATLCTRVPQCKECPLRPDCKSYSCGNASAIPFKSKKTKIENLYRIVTVIVSEDKILLRKGEKGAIMSDLHEFPYFSCAADPSLPDDLTLPFKAEPIQVLPIITHGFTRYQATLYPIFLKTNKCPKFPNHEWVPLSQIQNLPFSSGHRKILSHFLNLEKLENKKGV